MSVKFLSTKKKKQQKFRTNVLLDKFIELIHSIIGWIEERVATHADMNLLIKKHTIRIRSIKSTEIRNQTLKRIQ